MFNKKYNRPPRDSNKLCSSILDMIGNTPLVHLQNLSKDYDIKCNLCNFLYFL